MNCTTRTIYTTFIILGIGLVLVLGRRDENMAAPITGIANPRSVGGILLDLANRFQSVQKVYPYMDDPVTVTSHADAWAFGDAVTIIPANNVTVPFILRFADISNISGNDLYHLEFYENGSVIECSFTKSPTVDPVRPLPIQSCIIKPLSAVTMKLANQTTEQTRSCDVKVWYTEYV